VNLPSAFVTAATRRVLSSWLCNSKCAFRNGALPAIFTTIPETEHNSSLELFVSFCAFAENTSSTAAENKLRSRATILPGSIRQVTYSSNNSIPIYNHAKKFLRYGGCPRFAFQNLGLGANRVTWEYSDFNRGARHRVRRSRSAGFPEGGVRKVEVPVLSREALLSFEIHISQQNSFVEKIYPLTPV